MSFRVGTLFLKLGFHYCGEPPAPAGGGSTQTKIMENEASRSIPQVVTSMPAKGIKIRLQSREPRHPPMRSAEYSGEITFFWSSIPRDLESSKLAGGRVIPCFAG